MKKFILTLTFLLSSSSFASTEEAFLHRAYCENGKNRESKISQIQKEEENEESVSFRMVFTHGLCDSIELVRAPIKFQKRMLQITNYGLSHPFKKNHVRIEEMKSRSESELEARITLNKSALKTKNPRRYILEFWAGDWIGFPYVMTFTGGEEGTRISFEGFERL